MAFDLLSHPIVFDRAQLTHARSTWSGHIPFAYLLVDLLKPRTIVELGTQDGVSYVAFCHAVKTLGLTTQCTAIDTWAGDPHAGFYGPEILSELKKFHDPRYPGFSRLLQADFDKAVREFADGSIDLLHIDGLHTYEAVKHDFETYLPKLSDRAVVIFHDAAVRTGTFGVYRLIAELTPRYPNFEFRHSYGLGVMGVGAAVPEPMVEFLGAANAAPDLYRTLFARLGESFELLTMGNQLLSIQFQEMQVVNAFKAKCGLPVDANTQRVEVASGQPVPFASYTLQELNGIFSKLNIAPHGGGTVR